MAISREKREAPTSLPDVTTSSSRKRPLRRKAPKTMQDYEMQLDRIKTRFEKAPGRKKKRR